jgi:hypothetical protein
MVVFGRTHSQLAFSAAPRLAGFSLMSEDFGMGGMDERHFIHQGIPAMNLIAFARPWHYHSPSDVIENVGIQTVGQFTDALYNLMNYSSQEGWVESFEAESRTFFMPFYGVVISYGFILRLVITVLTLAAAIALCFSIKSLNLSVTKKGVLIAIGGVVALIILYAAAVHLFGTLFVAIWNALSDEWIGLYHHRFILFGVLVYLVTIPLAYLGLKFLNKRVGIDSLRLIVAMLFVLYGAFATFTLPGTEYPDVLVGALIILRTFIPKSKIVYFFTGITAGLLYFPVLYISVGLLGPSAWGALSYVFFIMAMYVLTKDYPFKPSPSNKPLKCSNING